MTPEPEMHGSGELRQPASSGPQDPATELQTLSAEVGQVPPLRPGERGKLIASLGGDGAERAAERLVETHLRVVLDQGLLRVGRGLTLGDLFQEGSVGLLAAIRAFPAQPETDFLSFITGQIALAMEDAILAEERAVKQERLLLEAAAEFDRVELELAREFRRVPTTQEIAARLEWSAERAETVRAVVGEARRVHDEELLQYVDPDLVDIADLISEGDVAPN